MYLLQVALDKKHLLSALNVNVNVFLFIMLCCQNVQFSTVYSCSKVVA